MVILAAVALIVGIGCLLLGRYAQNRGKQLTEWPSYSVGIIGVWGIHLTGLTQVSGSPWPARRRPVQAGRVAPHDRRARRRLLRLRVGDQVAESHRVVADGELKHPVEQQPRLCDRRRLKRKTNSLR